MRENRAPELPFKIPMPKICKGEETNMDSKLEGIGEPTESIEKILQDILLELKQINKRLIQRAVVVNVAQPNNFKDCNPSELSLNTSELVRGRATTI